MATFFRINITIINKTSTNLMALFFFYGKHCFNYILNFYYSFSLLNLFWIILLFFKLTLSYVVYKKIEKNLHFQIK
jgi:hypothetical protein